MFRRAAVPSSALRALRALIAPASTAAQNQQPQNLQNGCCTNREGFPEGEIGRLLALMQEVDHNGLSSLLDPLRKPKLN